MPKQVLAEDIERFLATLDGVASARLLTGGGGQIEQVYITAEEGAEARAARRAAAAALLSQYGIPIEPWRIQVVQLKRFAPSELPRLACLHVEESVSADDTTVRVQVAWDRGGDRRTAMGQARGPAGAAHRARTLAAAALDAARGVLDPPHRRIVLQQVAATTCMDRPLLLVAITATGPAGQEAFVGTAFQEDGRGEAPVAAALDAVTKWLLRAGAEDYAAGPGDRRAQLEALRHLIRSGGAAARPQGAAAAPPQAPPPPPHDAAAGAGPPHVAPPPAAPPPAAPSPAAPPPAAPPPAAPSQTVAPRPAPPQAGGPAAAGPNPAEDDGWGDARPGDAAPDIPGPGGPRPYTPGSGEVASAASEAAETAPGGGPSRAAMPPSSDILNDLTEIRPESRGGAPVTAHHEGRGAVASPRPSRPMSEEEFLQPLVAGRAPVRIRCRDGYDIPNALVREIGTYTLLVEADGGPELLYKHAIISIRPLGARG